jgi:3D (Asp-Asp-Asp) domain-containing protein
MSKRLSLALFTCFLLNLGAPAVSAASPDQLAEVAGKGAAINAQVQQLEQVKEAIESGKKQGVLGAIAAAALAKAQQDYGVPVTAGEDIVETVKAAAQQYVERTVQATITEKMAPYQSIVDRLGLLQQLNNKLNPQANKQNSSLTGAPEQYKKILDMTATAYAPGFADNSIWGDRTYVGSKVQKGVVAVDPSVIPMGTKLWVEGYGYAIADDQGSAIKGNRIDLAFNDFKVASDYGIQNVKVYILP